MNVSSEIQELLNKHKFLQLADNGKKVKCSLSSHEMPAKEDIIQSYISGKKYQHLKERHELSEHKYKQHLVPSNKKFRQHQLFCCLTFRHINKEPHNVQKHVEGRRFKKALLRWEECQKTGIPFRPLGRRPKHDKDISSEEEKESKSDNLSDLYPDMKSDGENQDDEISDTMSDLYPDEEQDDQKKKADQSDSDFESEDMDADVEQAKSANTQPRTQHSNEHSKKAKKRNGPGIPKQKKTKKFKTSSEKKKTKK